MAMTLAELRARTSPEFWHLLASEDEVPPIAFIPPKMIEHWPAVEREAYERHIASINRELARQPAPAAAAATRRPKDPWELAPSMIAAQDLEAVRKLRGEAAYVLLDEWRVSRERRRVAGKVRDRCAADLGIEPPVIRWYAPHWNTTAAAAFEFEPGVRGFVLRQTIFLRASLPPDELIETTAHETWHVANPRAEEAGAARYGVQWATYLMATFQAWEREAA